MLKNWKKNREEKEKRQKAINCYWAVSYLIKNDISEYMDLSFTRERTEYHFVVVVNHDKYGEVYRAQRYNSVGDPNPPEIIRFNYGEWVEALLEYRKTVEAANNKKQREDETERFMDLPE